MQTSIVRYKVKADKAEQNKAFIRKVFEELDASKPDGLGYVSFHLEDGLSFVQSVVVETDNGENPLPKTAVFQNFVADIRERCDEPPAAASADIVGSYRLFSQKASGAA